MDCRYIFTVFTGTFNRAQTLPRVYESLKAQTFCDFEWLIVDDGSRDGTKELVERWQAEGVFPIRESAFPIRYIYQENQGNHVAFNRGVQEAKGELFLPIDDDDACVPQALERLKYHWDSIPDSQSERFSGVTVLCQDQNGKLHGGPFPRDILDSNSLEMVFKYKVKGEKWGFHRTDVLKEFPHPTLADIKFIPDGVVWFALSRRFKTRFVNEILHIYHCEGNRDHLDALTPSTIPGRVFFHRQVLNEFIDQLPQYPWGLVRSAINFSRYCFDRGMSPGLQFGELRSWRARPVLAASMPVGYLMAIRDKRNVAQMQMMRV